MAGQYGSWNPQGGIQPAGWGGGPPPPGGQPNGMTPEMMAMIELILSGQQRGPQEEALKTQKSEAARLREMAGVGTGGTVGKTPMVMSTPGNMVQGAASLFADYQGRKKEGEAQTTSEEQARERSEMYRKILEAMQGMGGGGMGGGMGGGGGL